MALADVEDHEHFIRNGPDQALGQIENGLRLTRARDPVYADVLAWISKNSFSMRRSQ